MFDFGYYFKDFDRLMDKYKSRFDDKEKIREFKKNLREVAEENMMPLRINVSPIYKKPSAFHLNRYVFNCSPEFLYTHNSDFEIENIIKCLSKLPNKSHQVHSDWVAYRVGWFDLSRIITTFDQAYKAVDDYFDDKISYEETIKHFGAWSFETSGGWDWSSHKFSGGRKVGNYVPLSDLSMYKDALKTISKKLLKEARVSYSPSLRKWTRINRDYINGSSYKPLMEKSIISHKKSKVMVIHDCSGSMYDRWVYDTAVSYIWALTNSGVVDVTRVIYHSEYGWEDVKPRIAKWDIFHYSGGDEWFKYIDDNLPPDWIKEVDYVVVTTDLRFDRDEQNGLYEYIKRAPAHLILSFKDMGRIKDLNVRKVKTIKDMVNATITLAR